VLWFCDLTLVKCGRQREREAGREVEAESRGEASDGTILIQIENIWF
jgi:hypothetical protein